MTLWRQRLEKAGTDATQIRTVDPRALGSRKRLEIVAFESTEGPGVALWIAKKSRVLVSEAEQLEALKHAYEDLSGPVAVAKALIDAPLCSRAKAFLEVNGWEVSHGLV